MNDTGQTIAKNASFLMASQLLSWILALLVILILPRELGPTAMGKWYLAGTIWSLTAVFITFGTDTLLTKEIARKPEKSGSLFITSVILRIFLFLVSVSVLSLFLKIVDYPTETVYLIFILGITQIIWTISSSAQATLEGLERMEYISLANFVGKTINTFTSILVVLLGYGVIALAIVSIIPALVSLIIQLKALHNFTKFKFHFDYAESISMLRGGIPYFASMIFLVVYAQVDVLLLSFLTNERTLGWYFTAEHLGATLLFIPTVFMQAVFPALARMHTSGSNTTPRLVSRSFNLLFFCGVPIGLGLFIIAGPLVQLIYGPAFTNSGPILAITGIALIFMYQNILMGRYIISIDRQNSWTVLMAVATLMSIPISFVLISWCAKTFGNGGIGGALAFVITESGMFVVALRLIPAGILTRTDLILNLRVLAAGVIMFIITWFFRDLFIVIPIAVGVVSYAILITILRAVPKEDITFIQKFTRSAMRRLQNRISPTAGVGEHL